MGKKKEKVKFNTADYNYINSMPLEGWIWEFIRRNPEYRRLYSEIKKDPYRCKHPDFLLYEYGMEANRDYYYPLPEEKFLTIKQDNQVKIKTKHTWSRSVTLGIPNPDITYEDFERYYSKKRKEHLEEHKEHFESLQEYLEKYSIFSTEKKPKEYLWEFEINFKKNLMPIILNNIVKMHKFNKHQLKRYKQLSDKNAHYRDPDFSFYCVHTLTLTLTPTKVEDTIYVGISKYASFNDLKQVLLKIYETYIKPDFNIRKRPKEWKNYLIAYDLEDKYKIIDIASLLYPKEENIYPDFRVSKKISKHIQEAKKLINEKQYLKFLSLDIS